MKVALVHDYLNQYGGAERVLEAIGELFPKAPIFTLLYDPERTYYKFAHRTVIPSGLGRIPGINRRHRLFIPLMPFAADRLKARGYDLVISSSAGYAKAVDPGGAFHLTYCHTPLRYAWEAKEYIHTHPMFQNALARMAAAPLAAYLRRWDKQVSTRPNIFVANSQFIADKVNTYYGRDAFIVHPPVDHGIFSRMQGAKRTYYLAIGRLLHYKRFDLIIDAFNELDIPLVIAGEGPEREKLAQRIKNKNIVLAPYVEDERELARYYNGAKALIFPQVEDFGLVAAEAVSCGTPVIAYRAGGAEEIVEEGKTGLFFNEQTPEAIRDAVSEFEKQSWNSRTIAASAKRFSKERFQNELLGILRNQGFEV